MVSRAERTPFSAWWWTIDRLLLAALVALMLAGIVLSLAGLLVPIPLMALDLLTGAVQAYIFAVLAMVFIAGAVSEAKPAAGISSKRTAP